MGALTWILRNWVARIAHLHIFQTPETKASWVDEVVREWKLSTLVKTQIIQH
ncbi:hypothetical protein NIES4074_39540 [Cylindrospermum sp. NIES-4074]|nr:hypothetical protein NIES4074_39540 [Cylindrospermum sp. NIES-4074]